MNNFTISGYVCKGREDFTTQSGKTVTNFTVNAPKYNPTTGQSTPRFFECKYWQDENDYRQAHILEGAYLALSGSLDYETWQAKDGSNRSKVVLMVKEVGMVRPPRQSTGQATSYQQAPSAPAHQAPQAAPRQAYQAQAAPAVDASLYDEDIPFDGGHAYAN